MLDGETCGCLRVRVELLDKKVGGSLGLGCNVYVGIDSVERWMGQCWWVGYCQGPNGVRSLNSLSQKVVFNMAVHVSHCSLDGW